MADSPIVRMVYPRKPLEAEELTGAFVFRSTDEWYFDKDEFARDFVEADRLASVFDAARKAVAIFFVLEDGYEYAAMEDLRLALFRYDFPDAP